MSTQPNRLSAERSHHFHGRQIDRTKPLRFKLGGHVVEGFAGDTVLSASLASSIVAAGTRNGQPIALDERFAPPVIPREHRHDLSRALPMERTPALDGADYLLLDSSGKAKRGSVLSGLAGALGRRATSLGLRFDAGKSLAAPWRDSAPQDRLTADLIVVGGGIAGLNAALTANDTGLSVLLVDRAARLGGDAGLFGSLEGEDPPQVLADSLAEKVTARDGITVLTRAEALSAHEGVVRVHQVQLEGESLSSRTLDLRAPRIVLATGASERLPVFPGNRLPGIVGTLSAFARADRFGVWLGRQVLLSTSASPAYRLAMMASDAGIVVQRMTDTRLNPNSRFIEFSKAYGITLASGLLPMEAQLARRGRLAVRLRNSLAERAGPREPIETEQFIVCGGWQPDLTLWHMIGGNSAWDAKSGTLVAQCALENVALAGSAAGFRSMTGCAHSGLAAIATLLGRPIPLVDDLHIDPVFETPDAPTFIAPYGEKSARISYLDWGASLTTRPEPPPTRKRPFGGTVQTRWPLADRARALSLSDVAAGVQLRSVPESEAGTVARERSLASGERVDTSGSEAALPARPDLWQSLLEGRFGPSSVRTLQSLDQRSFPTGALLYRTSDKLTPLEAVGTVLAGNTSPVNVLVADSVMPGGGQVWVNDGTRPVAALLSALPAPAGVGSAEVEPKKDQL